ncbi:hypothetical protein EXE59_22035 [Nocardioides eburneiflavus]|uniref:Uncharacterized protein n=1 Tax=Nocardioides eburneiflavus TaxID=2518372 RepID=A0A4Z1CMZ0_9ACTN|nr:RHS repeat-associated core domain-containing protein [Nocardioides eburneiflavus]TGN66335.1 hypothetical protein EXE59_22035 [Nocardioides eburneiflavus]
MSGIGVRIFACMVPIIAMCGSVLAVPDVSASAAVGSSDAVSKTFPGAATPALVPPTRAVVDVPSVSWGEVGLARGDAGVLNAAAPSSGSTSSVTTSETTTSMLAAPDLAWEITAPTAPVRWAPNDDVTVTATVHNYSGAVMPASLLLSYRWTRVGDASADETPGNVAAVALGEDLAPGQSTTLDVVVEPPINSDEGAKRLDYDFYLDLWNGSTRWSSSNPPSASPLTRPNVFCAMAAAGLLCPDRLVEDASSNQLGLERWLTYAGEATGAGSGVMTNLYEGNLVWSYDPISNPSVGPSTFVRLAYNSTDVTDDGTGFGWSVQTSTLTRLGSRLSVPSSDNGAAPQEMTFIDGDGTTHVYERNDATKDDPVVTYAAPAGVHLSLAWHRTAPSAQQWVFSRPDGTRFFYRQGQGPGRGDAGLPNSIQDRHGNALTFGYDTNWQLTSLGDATGRETLTLGWVQGQLRWLRDLSGRGIRFTYDAGQVTRIEDGAYTPSSNSFAGPVKTFDFTYAVPQGNKHAKLTSVTDPRDATTTIFYIPTGDPKFALWPERLTDRRGHDTTYAYEDPDAQDGSVLRATVTNANGTTPSVTAYEMNSFGLATSIIDANANALAPTDPTYRTDLAWDADNNVQTLIEPAASPGAPRARSRWLYDLNTGYLKQQWDSVGDPVEKSTRLTYEPMTVQVGQTGQSVPLTVLTSTATPEGRTSTYGYHPNGDLKTVTNGAGETTAYTYNPDGTLATATDPRGHTTTYENYDPNGMPRRIIDPITAATTSDPGTRDTNLTYDVRGNVTQISDQLSRITTAEYDAFGRPWKITTPHQPTEVRTTQTDYDLNDNVVEVTDPTGAITQTTYTAMDAPATITLPGNGAAGTRKTEMSYDDLDRVLTETTPLGVASTTIAEDHQTIYTYDHLGQVLTVTTPHLDAGQWKRPTTRYTYDRVSNLVKVEDPRKSATLATDDYTTLFGYDLAHRQDSVTDALGNASTTAYDYDGLVTAQTDQDGNDRTYTYDAASRVATVTTPHTPIGATAAELRVTTYGYDNTGNPTTVTNPSGRTTETTYDALNRPIQRSGPFRPGDTDAPIYDKPANTFFSYDAAGQLKRQSNPSWATTGQHWTEFDYWDSGDVKSSTDPWNLVTTYDYDRAGRQTSRTIKSTDNSANRTMTWTYWSDGSLRTRNDNAASNAWEPPIVVDNDTPGTSSTGTWTLDTRARTGMVGTSRRTSTTTLCDGRACDSYGTYTWPVTVPSDGTYNIAATCPQATSTEPNYASYSVATDHGTRIAQLDQRACSTGYAAVRNVELLGGQPYKITAHISYEDLGDIDPPTQTLTSPLSTPTLDPEPPTQTTSRTTVADADAVKLTKQAQGRAFEYSYDLDGSGTQVRRIVDGLTVQRWTSTPDGLGRIIKVEESAHGTSTPRRTTTYTYDANNNVLTTNRSRPRKVEGNGESGNENAARYTAYTYDARDQVVTVQTGSSSSDTTLKTTHFTYDSRGMRDTLTKANGNTTTYTYHEDGLPKRTEERRTNGDLVSRHLLWFNADGDRRRDDATLDHPDTAGTLAQDTVYTYTPAGQLEKVTKSGAEAGKDEFYRYDAAGNTIEQRIGDTTANTSVSTYERNRLDQTQIVAPNGTVKTTNAYTYDPWGRLWKVTQDGVKIKEYQYDGFDRLIKDQQFLLVPAGANDVTKTTTYDAFDRTTSVTTKVQTNTAKTTRYTYLGLSDQVVQEERKNNAGAWAVAKAFTYGPSGEKLSLVDSPVNSTDPSTTLYYGTNPHGDIETLTNPTGEVDATYRYHAYGAPDPTGTKGLDEAPEQTGTTPVPDDEVTNPYRFNGKRIEPTTGQYDMGFRNYDPGLNRFLTRDMYNGALDDLALGMDPWNTNRYAFSGGNPITGVELDGHASTGGDGAAGGNPSQETFEDDWCESVDNCSKSTSEAMGWDYEAATYNPNLDFGSPRDWAAGVVHGAALSVDLVSNCGSLGTAITNCGDYLTGGGVRAGENAADSFARHLGANRQSFGYMTGDAFGVPLPSSVAAGGIRLLGRGAANAGDDVVRALSATERRTLDDALRPDKLNHIFDPKHNFQPLVQQFGSREAAMEQIVRSIGGPLPQAGRFEIAQSIGGQAVVIRGAVVDGIPRIGTAFTP